MLWSDVKEAIHDICEPIMLKGKRWPTEHELTIFYKQVKKVTEFIYKWYYDFYLPEKEKYPLSYSLTNFPFKIFLGRSLTLYDTLSILTIGEINKISDIIETQESYNISKLYNDLYAHIKIWCFWHDVIFYFYAFSTNENMFRYNLFVETA